MQTTEDVQIDLAAPRSLELLINGADEKEVPALLLKTLSQVDADGHKGKNRACRFLQTSQPVDTIKVAFDDDLKPNNSHPEDLEEYDNPWEDLNAARPAVLRKQIIDNNHGQGRHNTQRVDFQQKT